MRARNIKPGIFLNEILGQADPIFTLLFEGLWCMADKAGRLEDRPLRIKAEVFPYREGLDINGELTQLERWGFIQRYEVGSLRLIQVVNFEKHQNPHHTERKSELPGNSNGCAVTVVSPLDNGGNPPDSLIPDSLIPDSCPPAGGPPKAGKPKRPQRVEVLGEYPAELYQAVEHYRGLMKDCKADEVLNLYTEEKRFIAKQIGANEATWTAWKKRLGKIVHGSAVTNLDMLAAVDRLIQARGYNATKGLGLNVPMLPTLINDPVFVDALVKVKEVEHAS